MRSLIVSRNCAPAPDPVDPPSSLTVEKTVTAYTNAAGAVVNPLVGPVAVGDKITYAIKVCNTGQDELSNVAVSDPNAVVTGSPIAILAVGACVTLSAVHTVTAADLAAGKADNTARATGTDPNGNTTNGQGSATQVLDKPSALTVVKTVASYTDAAGVVKSAANAVAGDIINYSMNVCNNGQDALTNVTVTDINATVIGGSPIAALAVGACSIVTARHVVTAADIAAGKVDNQATATGTDPNGNAVSGQSSATAGGAPGPTTQPLTPAAPRLSVTKKTTSSAPYSLGSKILYDITVTNTGSVGLTNVVVTDPNATILSGSPVAALAVGASVIVKAEHVVTAADLAAGSVTNQATANGDSPAGPASGTSDDPNTPAPNDPTVTPLGPKLLVTKTVSPTPTVPGVPATYTITVQNTGVVTAAPVTVTDAVPAATPYVAASIAGGDSRTATGQNLSWTINSLAPGATAQVTYRATPTNSTAYTNTAAATAPGAPPAQGNLDDKPCIPAFGNTVGSGGVLNGVPFTWSYNGCPGLGSAIFDLGASANNGAFTLAGAYSPPIPAGTVGKFQEIRGGGSTGCMTVTFAQPVTDVILNLAGAINPTFTIDPVKNPGVTGLQRLTDPANGLGVDVTGNNITFAPLNSGANGAQGANGSVLVQGTYSKITMEMPSGNTSGDSFWVILSQCNSTGPVTPKLEVTKTQTAYTSPPITTPLTGLGGTAAALNGKAEFFTWPNLNRPLVAGDLSNVIEWGGCEVRLRVTSVALNGPDIGPNGSFRPVSVGAPVTQHGSQLGANGFESLRGVNSYSNGDISFAVEYGAGCNPADFGVFAGDGETVEGAGNIETMRVRFNGGSAPTSIGGVGTRTVTASGNNVTWNPSQFGNEFFQSVGATSLDVNFVEPGTGGKQGVVQIGLRRADGSAPQGPSDPNRAIAGDRITYDVTVCNTGTGPTTAAGTITDAGAVLSAATFPVLAVGACATVTATRTVTAAEIASGKVSNVANAASGALSAASNTVVTEVCNSSVEALTNGSMAANLNSWSVTPAGTWQVAGPGAVVGASTPVPPIGQPNRLRQVVDYPPNQPAQRIRFNLTALDGANLTTSSGTLQLVVNGVVYATWTNPIGAPPNVPLVMSNGATLIQGKNPLSFFQLVDTSFYEIEIPAQPGGPMTLDFIGTRTAGPNHDRWMVRDVQMSVNSCL
jgi:uncharacterized repeat protein (TIGR01451 family)